MVTSADTNPDASRVLSDLAESAADGFRRARTDARRAAKESIPIVRRSLAKTAYTLAYFVGFGATYSAAVVNELLPEDGFVRQGLRDGAEAARQTHAARQAAHQRRREANAAADAAGASSADVP